MDSPFPRFLWMIGIEGSGHFLLRAVLEDYLGNSSVIDKGPHYPLLLQRWDAEQQPLPRGAVGATLDAIFGMYAVAGITAVYEDTSFPFGGNAPAYEAFASGGSHRGALRRPDILDMLELLEGRAEVRILVAYRSPVLTVASALRRGFSQNLHFECRLAEAIHLSIVGQLAQLPPDCYRTFCFEEFVRRPEAHVEPLAEWWRIPVAVIAGGLGRIRRAGSEDDIPPRQLEFLREHFTERRVSQWIGGYQQNPLVTE